MTARKKTSKKKTCGEYRPILKSIHGDKRFNSLCSEGRHLFYALKVELGASGIEFIPAYREHFREITDLTRPRIDKGFTDLQEKGFLEIEEEGRILWLRDGLKEDPNMSTGNANQRISILKHLRDLPEFPIIREFAKYYSLPDPFGYLDELGDEIPQEELDLDPPDGDEQ